MQLAVFIRITNCINFFNLFYNRVLLSGFCFLVDRIRVKMIGFYEITRSFSYHDDRGVRISAYNRGHDARVDNA